MRCIGHELALHSKRRAQPGQKIVERAGKPPQLCPEALVTSEVRVTAGESAVNPMLFRPLIGRLANRLESIIDSRVAVDVLTGDRSALTVTESETLPTSSTKSTRATWLAVS